jgi:hypothetical protein
VLLPPVFMAPALPPPPPLLLSEHAESPTVEAAPATTSNPKSFSIFMTGSLRRVEERQAANHALTVAICRGRC